MLDVRQLEPVVWSIADGRGSDDDLALFHADEQASLRVLDRLIDEAEADLASVRSLPGDERDQVVADFTETLHGLQAAAARLRPPPPDLPSREIDDDLTADDELEPAQVKLQASWSDGHIVVWAAGRGTEPDDNDALATRLETIGGPPVGWQVHPGVSLPRDQHAEAVSIPLKDALGWLVAVGAGHGHDDVGASVVWLGRAALEGVRIVARGAIVPGVRLGRRTGSGPAEVTVRWSPALLDTVAINALAASMPGTVAAIDGGRSGARATATAVMSAAAEAIIAESVERMEVPAAPPSANSPRDFRDSVIARMDGEPFRANAAMASEVSRRFDQWSRAVTDPARPNLVVQLDAPSAAGVWLLSVFGPARNGSGIVPIDGVLRGEHGARAAAGEWKRLCRLLPALERASVQRRGQVAMSQDEAWTFMTRPVRCSPASGSTFECRSCRVARRLRRCDCSPRASLDPSSARISSATSPGRCCSTMSSSRLQRCADSPSKPDRSSNRTVDGWRSTGSISTGPLPRSPSANPSHSSRAPRSCAPASASTAPASPAASWSRATAGPTTSSHAPASRRSRRSPSRPDSPARSAPTRRRHSDGSPSSTHRDSAAASLSTWASVRRPRCLLICRGSPSTRRRSSSLRPRSSATGRRRPPGSRPNATSSCITEPHGRRRTSWRPRSPTHRSSSPPTPRRCATSTRSADISWHSVVLDEAQAIKNPASETAQQLRRIEAHTRLALTGTPIENGLGDLWAILDFTNPGLVGSRPTFIAQMSGDGEDALRALNGILLFRRTKTEPEVAAELPDKIDELDHCTMTPEQIGLYQAVLDELVRNVAAAEEGGEVKKGAILAAITALKQICNHPSAYRDDGQPLAGRSGKLARLEEIVESVFAAGERILIFTHFATWGRRLAEHLTALTGTPIACYDGSLSRTVRDRLVTEFQNGDGAGALVLSLKAGGTGLNLTSANHVVLYDRWWNPAVEDQARDRAWRIGQGRTVISHRLVCPGTIDERVEEVVAGKRHIAQIVLPSSSSLADLSTDQLRLALGLRPDELITGDER